MNVQDHERIRAFIDGELDAGSAQRLLDQAQVDRELDRELKTQQALRRALSGLGEPELPAALRPRSPLARLVELVLGLRALRISLPAATIAGFLLFAAGALLSRSRAPVPSPACDETVPVRFVFTGKAKQVQVAGTFNGWSPAATPLHQVADDVWEATVAVPRGEQRYMFRVDGAWRADPLAPSLVPDGMGNLDAVIQL